MKLQPLSPRFIRQEELGRYYPSFQSLLYTCFPHLPEHVAENYIHQWSKERLTSFTKTQGFLGIFQEDSPLGFAVISPPEGGVGTLFWLMVEQTKQGLGLGSLLLKEVEQQYRFQECHKIKLTAPSEQACRFYEKKGFVMEGFHPNHWYEMDFWSLAKQISRNS